MVSLAAWQCRHEAAVRAAQRLISGLRDTMPKHMLGPRLRE